MQSFIQFSTVRKIIIIPFFLLGLQVIYSQPLSGNYTIGGNSPDYVTLQDAANALKVSGISSSVFFNIRPGTYKKNGGNNTVLVLDSAVAGLSSVNRITFQPDAATGGNVDNVILEKNINDPNTANQYLVSISLDYVTFHNLTFKEDDASQHTVYNGLVKLLTSFYNSPVVEEIVFEGCKFIGSNPNGTQNGIEFGQGVKDITIRENTFIRLLVGISGNSGNSTSTGSIIIEDNQFLAGWRSSSGAGDPLGSAMEVRGTTLIIKGNLIDFEGSFNGGYRGISAIAWVGTETIIIEQNSIKGLVSAAINVSGSSSWTTDSLVVANNMINTLAYQVWANEVASGIYVRADNAKILFNTIVLYGGGLVGLGVYGDDCEVFNNIIIAKPSSNFNIVYDQGNSVQSVNLQSDYNIIFREGSGQGPLVIRNGIQYYSFLVYQTATGLDTNSLFKNVEFVEPDDLHLTECQSQDPELRGIPIQGITLDIDGEIRNETSPMIGADENIASMNDMFGDPFITDLPGTAFSITSAKFDNLIAEGFAVPDYDNNQVLLFHYNGDRTFSHTGTIQTPYSPTVVKFFDLDKDGYLDLLIGLYQTVLKICWGDGIGGFPTSTDLIIPGRVRSIEVGNDNFLQEPQVFLTIENNGFPSDHSFMAYIADDNGRENVEVVLIKKPGGSNLPDTIYAVMDDMAIANIDNEPNDEIVALTAGISSEVYIFNDSTVSGVHLPYSTHYRYVFGNTASLNRASSISIDDFDGDGDNDIVTTSSSSNEIVLLRNLGNYSFADEEILVREARGFIVMDYENDGDMDIVTMNSRLETNGITVFLNDGLGNFTTRENCYFPHADGVPWSIIASDFDLDGRTDIAITSTSDSLYVLYNLGGGTVGIDEQETEEIPTTFSLSQNYPNPFNPSTTIKFSIPNTRLVSLSVYNILGEQVKTLINQEMPPGNHSVQFIANHLASGIYFYKLQAGAFVETKKMILLK
jgi:hypothetical protein